MIDLKALAQAIGYLDEDTVYQILERFISCEHCEEDVQQVVLACQQGMAIVGELFRNDDYYVADLIFAGELMSRVVELLKPIIYRGNVQRNEKIVIGTVEGDLHDIGKNILKSMLEAEGFEVHDLGIDVEPIVFVEKIREVKPQVLAMSAVLTVAQLSMKNTVDALKEAGLRDEIKIIIGGTPVSKLSCEYIGADAFTTSATEGVKIIQGWVNL